jgi:ethanolamine ammonia-lyase small subunit
MATPADPFARFRIATRARIGLGRCGDSLPTAALLDFQLAHARARDAVHSQADFAALAATVAPLPTVEVHSAAADRSVYLRRPDLGRRLADADRARLEALPRGEKPWDIVFVIGDGLSATAVSAHAAATFAACVERLPKDWTVGPLVLARQARVALGDDAAHALGARLVAMLIGERPGLSVADSLGIYLTFDPHPGRLESERNCISNIHASGLSYAEAGFKLAWLAVEARQRKISGIGLKDEAPPLIATTAETPKLG